MTSTNLPAVFGHQSTSLVTITDHIAPVIRMPVPRASTMQPLAGAVILIARSAGGVGADTLTALIDDQATKAGIPITLVDFTEEGDEGPAWQRVDTNTKQIKLKMDDTLGEEVANLIANQTSDMILINAPANALPDFAIAEADYGDLIVLMRRPYFIFWIDSPHDEPSDRLNNYLEGSGLAKCLVFARQPEGSRAQKALISIGLPLDCPAVLQIPRLPRLMANAFYKDRMIMESAFEQGHFGNRLAFGRRLTSMMTTLGDML